MPVSVAIALYVNVLPLVGEFTVNEIVLLPPIDEIITLFTGLLPVIL